MKKRNRIQQRLEELNVREQEIKNRLNVRSKVRANFVGGKKIKYLILGFSTFFFLFLFSFFRFFQIFFSKKIFFFFGRLVKTLAITFLPGFFKAILSITGFLYRRFIAKKSYKG